jgi:hypothetical protein
MRAGARPYHLCSRKYCRYVFIPFSAHYFLLCYVKLSVPEEGRAHVSHFMFFDAAIWQRIIHAVAV